MIDSDQPPRVLDKAELVASGQWTVVVLAPSRLNWPVVVAAGLAALGLIGSAWLVARGRFAPNRRARAGIEAGR